MNSTFVHFFNYYTMYEIYCLLVNFHNAVLWSNSQLGYILHYKSALCLFSYLFKGTTSNENNISTLNKCSEYYVILGTNFLYEYTKTENYIIKKNKKIFERNIFNMHFCTFLQ